jgi:nifR3 family TIM-barrel protein
VPLKKMNIGKLRLKGNLVLAPMADVTNLPFRLLCKKYGASLVYSEMIASDAVIRHNRKSIIRGLTCNDERPLGLQLLGSCAQVMADSALILHETYKPELFDVNIGCPDYKIMKHGCGSALLRTPAAIRDIITQLCGSLDVPVTAKMRITGNLDETLKLARCIESSGASALSVHGKTPGQKYAGTSNLEFIKKIKRELSIPVIANGGINNEETAKHVLEYTGCDGLMIGRAVIGAPFLFRRISHYLDKGELLPPGTFGETVDDLLEYCELSRKFGLLTYSDFKLKCQWFIRGGEYVRTVRKKINDAKDLESVIGIVRDLKEDTSLIQKTPF